MLLRITRTARDCYARGRKDQRTKGKERGGGARPVEKRNVIKTRENERVIGDDRDERVPARGNWNSSAGSV